ncbi:MAG: carbohydrate ABC transporter permease [Candidatus Cohnella colombiensis]|uniref:Carbohydrate ABC transporter permease n=1 Tax=Candidatus Cohnella colombiensis TaxID=3121368 RepID=A0AA95EVD1_9BACL|nr:MAG: carbohydrate ABC transporter permease [Cohnella sp.]
MATLTSKKKFYEVNQLSKGPNFLVNFMFWIYSILCIIPLFLLISVSFSDEKQVLINGYKFWPEKFSLEAYKFLLNDWQPVVKSYGISIFVTVVGTAIAMLMMTLFAYPISRKDFKHRNIFSFIMFFTILFNGGLVPYYLMYSQVLDLRNTLFVLMMPLFIQGFFVILIRTFFSNSIPVEVLESAKIDGAGELRIFFGIVLPLSLPVIASVGLLCTLGYWNDWFNSLLFITDNETISIQFRMYEALLDIQYLSANSAAYSAILQANPGFTMPSETARMAMAIVGVGPIIFAYPFFQRYFVSGLTVGAVKG